MQENSPMTKMHGNLKCSARYEEAKKADKIGKESRTGKLNFDADNQVPRFYSKISVFEKANNYRLYYICVFCNWCLYRRSVGLFNRD